MTEFLKNFGLPQSLHSLTANSDIPDAIWTKIEEFQKKGASQNFKGAIEGGEQIRTVNLEMLAACQKIIDDEEAEDNGLRQQHGAKFNRPHSSSVNGQYKQQMFDYKGKIEMASATDVQIKQKFEANQAGFQLLGKSRQELGASIP